MLSVWAETHYFSVSAHLKTQLASWKKTQVFNGSGKRFSRELRIKSKGFNILLKKSLRTSADI